MGWIYIKHKQLLTKLRKQHEQSVLNYDDGITAQLLASEWHDHTWYAIIKLNCPPDAKTPEKTFLRVDLVDPTNTEFGWKAMDESVGPYVNEPPSESLKKRIFKHIPTAPNEYAENFRTRYGIPFLPRPASLPPPESSPPLFSPTAPEDLPEAKEMGTL
jgi:hypothetical protein